MQLVYLALQIFMYFDHRCIFFSGNFSKGNFSRNLWAEHFFHQFFIYIDFCIKNISSNYTYMYILNKNIISHNTKKFWCKTNLFGRSCQLEIFLSLTGKSQYVQEDASLNLSTFISHDILLALLKGWTNGLSTLVNI